MSTPTHFKNWRIPGPQGSRTELKPQGLSIDENSSLLNLTAEVAAEVGEEVTLDYLCGYYRLFQLKKGHRFSTDDLLVAYFACRNANYVERILDLGSGIGTVSTLLAWKYSGSKLVTIEAQEISFKLTLASIALNSLENRVQACLGDLRSSLFSFGVDENQKFHLISSSPPYFPLGSGVLAEHPQKVACRFETRGNVFDYTLKARAHLAPAGVYVGIYPYEGKEKVLHALTENGFELVQSEGVVFKEGEKPLMFLYAAMLKEDLPPQWCAPLESTLIIRQKDGSISPEYKRIKLTLGFPPL